jgi:hypothetical protein
MNKHDLANKVDWEGGVWEAICGYGMDDSWLPENTPQEIRDAWNRVRATEQDVRVINEWLWDEKW